LVPVIVMSDATHLTNFSGDKKAWPVYMTIGNIKRSHRMNPNSYAVVLLGLLPVPFKMRKMPSKDRLLQRSRNREVLEEVLQIIIEPLHDAGSTGKDVVCADKRRRKCFPRLSGWIADFPEQVDIHGLKGNSCPWCECPQPQFGKLHCGHPKRDYDYYGTLWKSLKVDELTERGVMRTENVLFWLPGVKETFAKPDLLHTIYLGLFVHCMTWLTGFLAHHKRHEIFDEIYRNIPAYDTMTRITKSYSEISQWTGKEMRRLGRYLVCALQASLSRPNASQRPLFNQAISCVKALIDFACYSQYDSHDDDTLALLRGSLESFHKHKSVFLEWRTNKVVGISAEEMARELRTQRDEELEQLQAQLTKTQLQSKKDEWKVFIANEVEDYKRINSDFNFPKLHLLEHFEDCIRHFGALKQWSTETSESCHKSLLKCGYNASNRNSSYTLQILNFNARKEAFDVRRRNNDAMRPFDDVAHDIGSDLVFTGRIKKRKIQYFSQLEDYCDASMEDLCSQALRLPDISASFENDSTSLKMASVVVFKSVKCPVQNFQTNQVEVLRARCTGTKSWFEGPPRNDWIWYSYGTPELHEGERRSRAFNKGRTKASTTPAMAYRRVGRLLCLFILHGLDGVSKWRLAALEETIPIDGGHTQSPSDLPAVRKKTTDVVKIIPASRLTGPAHLIPESDGHVWWVNTYIDLTTWNSVYDEPCKASDISHKRKNRS
jgi:hypothetical protein